MYVMDRISFFPFLMSIVLPLFYSHKKQNARFVTILLFFFVTPTLLRVAVRKRNLAVQCKIQRPSRFTDIVRRQNMTTKHDLRAGYGITHTLEETAQLMGITRERVRQIEKRALAKIRALLKKRYGITDLAGFLG
ncbi:MAG: hypothetical protein IJH50_03075 [Kiritimatiellae bacterium]|nr:hypothetical protein [Kiritimatiellia bacterium]